MKSASERRLLLLSAAFLFVYTLILTFSPAVREHSWNVSLRLSQWAGFIVWSMAVYAAYWISVRRLPERDPFLFPLASLLAGWGLLTIWRIDSGLGLRQAIWLVVSLAAFCAIIYTPPNLDYLRRYKYILLGSGLVLTGSTLLMGINPEGFGPRLWLGCCGFYVQPSEPLKLLLVVYLSAYLADRIPIKLQVFPLILPTIFLSGLALLLLVVQRDLGTASLFILLYAAILYIATDKSRVVVVTAFALITTGLIGYFFIDIVHTRLETWINPWIDPTGHSYQIIQSLIAVANGGIVGRGPGLGSPSLVPVAHSDFIFAAIAEETGLVGTIGMLSIFALLLQRGLITSLRSPDRFHRLLSAGITAYIGIQAILIIGGNLRILPLTGVTLPFVSYGGSSLLTSFIALGVLVSVGKQSDQQPAPLPSPHPYFGLASALALGLITIAISNLWWVIVRGQDILARTDNPRRSIADRYVSRGRLLDRNNQPIDITVGTSGTYLRMYLYPPLAPLVGYTHPTFGQAGLESSLDDYLRGLQGNPASLIWWDRLVYGTPPPGLDVRLSLDLTLQKQADVALGESKGAIVELNANSGEILVMSSHPTYDPNKLDQIGTSLAQDPNAPLIDRASQGLYPPGTATEAFQGLLLPGTSSQQMASLYSALGFYSAPDLNTLIGAVAKIGELQNLRVSPLQMAIAAATLSNAGIRPAPRIALAVDTYQQGWVVLPAQGESIHSFSQAAIDEVTSRLEAENHHYWEWNGFANSAKEPVSWFLAGTLPGWQGTPISLVVLVEGLDPSAAQQIGRPLIQTVLKP